MAAGIIPEESRAMYGRLIGELRAERDIARERLARACFQRDALLFVLAGMWFGMILWRWF